MSGDNYLSGTGFALSILNHPPCRSLRQIKGQISGLSLLFGQNKNRNIDIECRNNRNDIRLIKCKFGNA